MKKHLVCGLATAAVLLSACSSDELLDVPQAKEITFANVSADKLTRAGVIDNTTLKDAGFTVSGWILDTYTKTTTDTQGLYILQDEPVTYTTDEDASTGTWSYTNTQYWTAGKTYYFAAYAPSSATVTDFLTDDDGTSSDNRTLSDGSITGSLKFSNQANSTQTTTGTEDNKVTTYTPEVDLVYAATSTTTEATKSGATNVSHDPVSFTFNHLLSKVIFKVKSNFKNKFTTISVDKFTITNAYASGTVTLTTGDSFGKWELDNGTFEAYMGETEDIDPSASATTAGFFLIPDPETKVYTATFTIHEKASGTEIAAYDRKVNLPTVAMKAGYTYTYSMEISNANIESGVEHDPITFTVSETAGVTTWADGGTTAATVGTNVQ